MELTTEQKKKNYKKLTNENLKQQKTIKAKVKKVSYGKKLAKNKKKTEYKTKNMS